jgi:lipid II:glycine glycyltransferase (peptidoglycan interpeptide bridge formation enzyme)
LVSSVPAQPPSTLRLELGKGEERLLAEMKQKWRYNIRLAERKDVEVAREEKGTEGADILARLIRETAERNGFAARTPDYYRAVWQVFDELDQARLYVARFKGQALGAMLVVHYGDTATYLYGGSSERERQRMPNHALQWAAIQGALAEGLEVYDFWGIPDAIGQAVGRGEAPESVEEGEGDLWGVWGFKRGFGGGIWRAAGAWDMVHAPLRYKLAMRLRSG